ncbi:MAG: hypothetical protein ACRYGK_00175 [Janthinobacterium lividum]
MIHMTEKELTDRLRVLFCRITCAASTINGIAKTMNATEVRDDGDTLCPEVIFKELALGTQRDSEEGYGLLEELEACRVERLKASKPAVAGVKP